MYVLLYHLSIMEVGIDLFIITHNNRNFCINKKKVMYY